MNGCKHLSEMKKVTPSADGCEDCLKTDSWWVHLRLCEMCGHVGCCDSSPNKHATKHFHTTNHAIVKSLEPGEDWGYCYVWRPAIIIRQTCNHPHFEIKLFATIIFGKLKLTANELKLSATSLQS